MVDARRNTRKWLRICMHGPIDKEYSNIHVHACTGMLYLHVHVQCTCMYRYVALHVHDSSKGLSPTTNPKPTGISHKMLSNLCSKCSYIHKQIQNMVVDVNKENTEKTTAHTRTLLDRPTCAMWYGCLW